VSWPAILLTSRREPLRTALNSRCMRVLGIDCGTEFTGFGICEQNDGPQLLHVASGVIALSRRESLPRRLNQVFDTLQALIVAHRPELVAIEEVFYSVNAKSALKLGQVRGVAMLAAAANGLSVAEYAPLAIKSSVTGYGRAEKLQVQAMVKDLLRLECLPDPPDVADALAIAICHLHTASTLGRQAATAGNAK
jgi:crossover junction endodeoxyribonuclease RuvC